MGWFSGITDTVSGGWNKLTGAGTSSFKPENYQYDESAFKDPYLENNRTLYNERAGEGLADQNTFAKAIYARAFDPNAPSVAQEQLRMGQDANTKNAYAMASSANGVNPGLAFRAAMDAGANASAQTNGQSALLRATEGNNNIANALAEQGHENSMEQFYRTLGYNEEQASLGAKRDLEEMRGNAALSRSGQSRDVALYNSAQRAKNVGGLMSGLAQGGSMMSSMGGGGGGGSSSPMSMFSSEDAKFDIHPETVPSASKYHLDVDTNFAAPEAPPPKNIFSQGGPAIAPQSSNQGPGNKGVVVVPPSNNQGPVDIYGKFFDTLSGNGGDKKDSGGGGGGGGMMETAMKLAPLAMAAFSDETMKKDKHAENGSSNDLYHFLDAIQAYKYKYKNPDLPGAGHGEHYSVMAQDLEKTPVGESMVDETPQGKMVDYGKGFGAMLASMAQMHDRVKALESKRR
jgi:hypothetical protein